MVPIPPSPDRGQRYPANEGGSSPDIGGANRPNAGYPGSWWLRSVSVASTDTVAQTNTRTTTLGVPMPITSKRLAVSLAAAAVFAAGCGSDDAVALSDDDVTAIEDALIPLRTELREATQDPMQSFTHLYSQKDGALAVFTDNDRMMVCERVTDVIGTLPDPARQVPVWLVSEDDSGGWITHVKGGADEPCTSEG